MLDYRPRTVSATGSTVRNAVAEAKRLLGNSKLYAAIVNPSGDGENLYRVTLNSGDVVEVTTQHHARSSAQFI